MTTLLNVSRTSLFTQSVGSSWWLFFSLLFWGQIQRQTSPEQSIFVLDNGFQNCQELKGFKLLSLWFFHGFVWMLFLCPTSFSLFGLQAALSPSCPNRALLPGTVKEMARKQASQVRQLQDANLDYISLTWPRWKTTARCLKFSLAQNPDIPRI